MSNEDLTVIKGHSSYSYNPEISLGIMKQAAYLENAKSFRVVRSMEKLKGTHYKLNLKCPALKRNKRILISKFNLSKTEWLQPIHFQDYPNKVIVMNDGWIRAKYQYDILVPANKHLCVRGTIAETWGSKEEFYEIYVSFKASDMPSEIILLETKSY